FAALDALLIAQRPNENRGMIAIAQEQALQLAEDFRAAADRARLIHHEHAKPITGFEQLRRGRIMGGAISVAAHFLEFLDAEVLDAIRQGRADARMVLMIAGALDLNTLAVQEKALVRIEADRADAERSFVTIHLTAAALDRSDKLVKVRRFERPQSGVANRQLHRDFAFLQRLEGNFGDALRSDRLAIDVLDD